MMGRNRMQDLRGYSHPSVAHAGPALLRGYRSEAMREALKRIIERAPRRRDVYCTTRGWSNALQVVSHTVPRISDRTHPLRLRLAAGTNAWERSLFEPL